MSARILVIDDSEHLRQVIQMTLAFKGHRVTSAGDGAEALQRVGEAQSEGGFDLIYCDIEMEGMDGIEFVRQYRAKYGTETPIVMLTAEEGPVLRKAIEAGATDVVIKPFEPIRLLEEVERYLGNKRDRE
jgi:CheY-like chemotaxis protein